MLSSSDGLRLEDQLRLMEEEIGLYQLMEENLAH